MTIKALTDQDELSLGVLALLAGDPVLAGRLLSAGTDPYLVFGVLNGHQIDIDPDKMDTFATRVEAYVNEVHKEDINMNAQQIIDAVRAIVQSEEITFDSPIPVIVTTTGKGVFYGYTNKRSFADMTLTNARNVIYWPSEVGGFLGLHLGPKNGCRIGAIANRLDLNGITSVSYVTPEAAKLWDKFPVYKGEN